jgi:hypothetical protein
LEKDETDTTTIMTHHGQAGKKLTKTQNTFCYDRRLIQEESVKWLGAAGHQGSVGVWGWKPNYLHQYYY